MSGVNQYPPSVPVLIGQVVDRVRTAKLAELQEYDSTIQTITYMYGNMKEIVNNLAEYTNNPTYRFQKFPLFILVEDITIDRTNSNGTIFGTPNMNVIICNHTLKDYKSAQRETKNFANILRPLYREFLYQISAHKQFSVYHQTKIKHRMTERKFWGADDNTKNLLGDLIDAIDITALQVDVKWGWCE